MAACLECLEQRGHAPLPWYADSSSEPKYREILQAALKNDDQLSTLRLVLSEQDFVIHTKNELRDLKLEARKRGWEEFEVSAPAPQAREDLLQTWSEGEAQPLDSLRRGWWAAIPRQLTWEGHLFNFLT